MLSHCFEVHVKNTQHCFMYFFAVTSLLVHVNENPLVFLYAKKEKKEKPTKKMLRVVNR